MMLLFYFLLLSLPFVDHGLFGHQIGGFTVEKLMGAVCFVYALSYLPRRRTLPALFASSQAKALAVYVAYAVVSYTVTAETFTFTDFIGIFLSQFLFFITVMILVDSRERLQNSVLMVIGSMGFVSLYLIREWVANAPIYGWTYRPGWVAGDANMFSASALVVLPLMLHPKIFAEKTWQRLYVLGCLGVTLISFVLAASRGGFIGLICMYLWQLKNNRQRIVTVGVCALILAVCVVSPHSPLDRMLKPSQSDIESSNYRLQLWSVSAKILADHPIFGVGLWNFPKYMHRYLPPGVDLEFSVPHNTYLEAAVELGLIGASAFIAVLGLSIINSARLRKAARDQYFAALANGLSAGLVGFAVAAMFLSAKHDKLMWFAVFLSACIAPLAAADGAGGTSVGAAEVTVPLANMPAAVGVAAKTEKEPIRVGNWLMRH